MKYFIGNEGLFENKEFKTCNEEEAYNLLKDSEVLSLDIETTKRYNKYGDIEGLDPYTSKIVMFQLGDEDNQIIIDARYIHPGRLLDLLIDKDKVIVGQNLKFEYKHILHNYGIRINNLYDTMVVEKILTTGLKGINYSLETLIKFYLDIEVDKTTRLEFLRIGHQSFTLRQLQYGADDIIYPLKIRKLQLERLKKKDLMHTLKLESAFTRVLAEIEYNGMHFNKDKWRETAARNGKKLKQLEELVNKYVIDNFSNNKIFVSNQLDLFNPDPVCLVSWTSSKQVTQFFKAAGINIPKVKDKKTKKMKDTIEAKEIKASLKSINKNLKPELKQFIKDYITYKNFSKYTTTYGLDFFKYINPITNRLHSNFNQIITTGRQSSSNPNLQQIPQAVAEEYDKTDARYQMFRYCFDAPDGYDLINCDYSGQETVIMADRSEEKNLMHLIKTGGDSHCFVTKAIDPTLKQLTDEEIKDQHSDKRQKAKAANFAIQFGGTGFTIANNLGVTEEEGDRIYDAYFIAFPDLKSYFDKVIKQTRRLGYVLIDTITGRKSYFDKTVKSHDRDKRALNAPIQGTAASMTKLATIYYFKWIEENNLFDKVKITNTVHDELLAEAVKEISSLAAEQMQLAMEKAGDVFCKKVKIKAQPAIVEFWTH